MVLLSVEVVVSLVASLVIYNVYAAKEVKYYISVIFVTVLFLSFLNLILLPLDIYITKSRVHNPNAYDKENSSIKFLWILLYWVTFILSWVIIPICIEYEQIRNKKNLSTKDKLFISLKNNLHIYFSFLCIGLMFMVYLYYYGLLTLYIIIYFRNYLFAILITTSNLFGILIVILLIGYGLINIPRDIWVYSTNQKEIEYCQFRAFVLFYESVEADENNDFDQRDLLSRTESLLEDHQNRLFLDYERRLFEIELKDLCDKWKFYKEIEESQPDNYLVKYYKIYRPILLKFIAILLFVASFIIITSEITMFLGNNKYSFYGFMINNYDSYVSINMVCILSLLYLFTGCFYGLINLKIKLWRYYIYKNGSSNAVSLLNLAGFITRISFSLCLNFSLMINLDENINFEEIVMVIDLLPLFGKKFNMFFPMVLSFTCLFALFNVYSKILLLFGITNFEYKGYNKALKEGEIVLEKIARENELITRNREQLHENEIDNKYTRKEIRN